MPSLNTADTTLALSTIDESLSTGQRDPRTRDGATTTARGRKALRLYRVDVRQRTRSSMSLKPPTEW